jgi:hypothetical protein
VSAETGSVGLSIGIGILYEFCVLLLICNTLGEGKRTYPILCVYNS